MTNKNFHSLSIRRTIDILKTSKNGLSKKEAKKRLSLYGLNELPKEKPLSVFILLLKQLKNPIIYILLVAALISFATKNIFDGVFISIVILISSVISFVQEKKADDAISKLRNMIKYEIEVIRDGEEIIIPSSEVVVGDLMVLKQGDKIPADARVIEVNNLETSESALTGESVPIIKQVEKIDSGLLLPDRKNMVYAGTVVTRGEGRVLVVSTGIKSELGKISSLVKEVKDTESFLQKKMRKFSRNLGIVLIVVNVLIFLLGWLTGRDLYQMFLTSVAIVVAAVPEGLLPAMVIILAVGMQKILKKKGLVKKMMAAETLGSVSVICTDKTGTLTKGEMRVDQIVTDDFEVKKGINKFKGVVKKGSVYNHYLALKIGMLCNNVFIENSEDKTKDFIMHGNSTEKALYLAASQTGIIKKDLQLEEKRLAEFPFDSEYKFMATLHQKKKSKDFTVYIKGAPEKIIDFASFVRIKNKNVKFTAQQKKKINEQYLNLTSKGLRVIAVGYKEILKNSKAGKKFTSSLSCEKSFCVKKENFENLILVGFVALADPLRSDAKQSIKNCLKAGIMPVIITGDHKLTTKTIAEDLGLKVKEKNILIGEELDKMNDEELSEKLKDIKIFARVEPRHKLRIVKLWQKKGEVVAMTGDGVNDSPAIKAADIGLALGSGTDIAKETADLILLNDSFKVVVEAVRQGRIIFHNLKKVILYLLTDSFTEIVLFGGAIMFGWALPLLPAQILWIKIIEDSTPAMALAFDEVDENVMEEKPRKNQSKLLDKNSVYLIIFYAIIMDFTLLAIFHYYDKISNNIDYVRTITFVGLGIASLFYIHSVRGLKTSILKMNIFSNIWLILATIFGAIMLLLAVYLPFLNGVLKTVPLSLIDWTVLCCYGFLGIFVYEIGKKIFRQI
ncbi:MAG: HAD-IC family P-type ATPase [Patescibacteria group bacterium]|nr:HAD-IC family P-type ATPase [Patescibacteria group bacterium]